MSAATLDHVRACCATLDDALNGAAAPSSSTPSSSAAFAGPSFAGASCFFVTLTLAESGALRGCIGTLSPRPLTELARYARLAAFEDSRFAPLRAEELPSLRVGVSLLVRFEAAASVTDWLVGTHGISIAFVAAGRAHSATFLPEVAAERRWTQAQAVAALIIKAGSSAVAMPPSHWHTITCTRYQSSKVALDWMVWKNGDR